MLASGHQLGPYEIIESIGSGGMGEVYRARDPRLSREVAIKVLRPWSDSAADLRRFEREARATSVLNHPAVLAVYDVGTQDGRPYVVSELLEGETLRARLGQGPLPVRRALELAAQAAHGLAAAHEKGIVHRDLKPENLFVTRDGRLKILDFGLAKLVQPADGPPESDTGGPVGTTQYMSPEQVNGQPVDQRSDLFALGAVLYEMLSGRRAFQGRTLPETLVAIAREDPPHLVSLDRYIAPAVDRVVRRCLEKRPEERFGSARDLAYALEALATSTSDLGRRRLLPLLPLHRPSAWMGALAAVVLALGLGYAAGHGQTRPSPSFERLTFRQGAVTEARFAPDGRSIVFSAAWGGRPPQVYVRAAEDEDERSLGVGSAELLSVSREGELALLTDGHRVLPFTPTGTLATAPLGGGQPRAVLQGVRGADWAPGGTRMAVVREVEGRSVLELHDFGGAADGSKGAGNVTLSTRVLYTSANGFLSHPRFSPRGDRVAVLDHRYREGAQGALLSVDLDGHVRVLAQNGEVNVFKRPVWSPDGSEVWYSHAGVVSAVSLSGRTREVLRTPAPFTVLDIAPDGRVLASDDEIRMGVFCRVAGDTEDRDLSWLNWSRGIDLSPDARQLLMVEYSGPRNVASLRGLDGSPLVRLGEGEPKAFSPDGHALLMETSFSPPRLAVVPVGPGEGRSLPPGNLERISFGAWLPDGRRVVFAGNEPGHALRLWIQDVAGGPPRAFTAEGLSFTVVAPAPDGLSVAALGPDERIVLYPVDGGPAIPVPGAEEGDQPIRFAPDGSLYVFRFGSVPTPVRRLDVHTGQATLVREIAPTDRTGLAYTAPRMLSADGATYCYQALRVSSRLYLIDGMR